VVTTLRAAVAFVVAVAMTVSDTVLLLIVCGTTVVLVVALAHSGDD
jgi:hypothetical protein